MLPLKQIFITLITLNLLIIPIYAQETLPKEANTSNSKKSTNQPIPRQVKIRIYQDKLKRDTPRSSLSAFLSTTRDGDLKKASEYLDFGMLASQLTEAVKEEYAQDLRIILDRALWVDLSMISDNPEGTDENLLPESQELITTLNTSDGNVVDILMQRVSLPTGLKVWKFASSTVKIIPKLYKEYGYGKIGDKLSDIFPAYTFMHLELWQWAFLIIIISGAFLIAYISTKILALILKKTNLSLKNQLAYFSEHALRLFLFLLIARICISLLKPPAVIRAIMQAQTLFLLSIIWLACSLLGILRDYWAQKLGEHNKMTTAVILKPATNLVRLVLIIVIIMVWFENIGLNATTIITGFGIGGLAVALAAQKSIENFIGAVTLHASAPVKLGDFGKFGNYIGSVEFIGLRYTCIRTLDRTLVSIPNAVFVDMYLESFTERDKIRYSPVIEIDKSTSPEQLRKILTALREMLENNTMVEKESHRVRFKTIGDYSLDLTIVAYIMTNIYSDYLKIAEDLNLEIIDIIHKEGASLAIPSRNITMKNIT